MKGNIVKLTVFTESSAFDTLKTEWNALLHRSHVDTVFLTWEWQSTWWNAYHSGDLWIITLRDEADALIAIAPWFIEHKSDERVIRTIGCVDVTDYVDVIVAPEHREAVYARLARFLFDERSCYDRINLCNIPQESPTLELLTEQLKANGFEAALVFQEVCPIIQLPDSWEAYLTNLDKKQRHELRRKMRRAEGEAQLEHYVVNETHDFQAELTQFLELMRASQPDKARFLEDEQNITFFNNIAPLTFEKGWLRLSFLKINGVPSAAYFDFDYNDSILVYNSGLLSDENAHLSPGIVLLTYNIRSAIEAGRKVYDFLRGNETYKYRMGGEDTQVFKLVARVE